VLAGLIHITCTEVAYAHAEGSPLPHDLLARPPAFGRLSASRSFPRALSQGTAELMRGTGRCVRVEQLAEGGVVRFGIGVHIEKSTGLAEAPRLPRIRR